MNIEILKQVKLLYVEDDESIRNVLSRGLKRRVKELMVAVDGVDGLEKYYSFKPDIIVTDIKMPNMSGLEMSKKIRKEDRSTPIIITSAHGESEKILEAIEIGINGYILKPIDKNKLFDTITLYAKSKVLENELKEKKKQIMLQSKNAALGELIGNIAHQWRQPLSVISTSASGIQIKNELGIIDSESLIYLTDIIINTAKELSGTLEYFYNQSDIAEDMKYKFNISEVLNSVLKNIEDVLVRENIKVIKTIDETLTIYNYSNLFYQVVMKIVMNSIDILKTIEDKIKYIFIEITSDNDLVIIKIKDSAGGIQEDLLDKVFEPYFTTKHQSSGKGLGLYSALIMIQNGMNGNIEVKNEDFEFESKQYKGASFIIKIDKN